MSETALAYASVLRLSRTDIKILNIKDAYAIHKVVYGLFEDVRSIAEKQASVPSGIAYADKGGDFSSRQILILSNRLPYQTPQFGSVQTKAINSDYLRHERYAFEIVINPCRRDSKTHKLIPICGRKAIEEWFQSRAQESWGFDVKAECLQTERISSQSFEKHGKVITHSSAVLKGELSVVNRVLFTQSFTKGLGRGRAFGFGLLQIVPVV